MIVPLTNICQCKSFSVYSHGHQCFFSDLAFRNFLDSLTPVELFSSVSYEQFRAACEQFRALCLMCWMHVQSWWLHNYNLSSLLMKFIETLLSYLVLLLQKIPLVFAGRRAGDAEIVYASTEKAERELNWK